MGEGRGAIQFHRLEDKVNGNWSGKTQESSDSWKSQGTNWIASGNSQNAQELAQPAPYEGAADGEAEWEMIGEKKNFTRK